MIILNPIIKKYVLKKAKFSNGIPTIIAPELNTNKFLIA